MEADLSLRQRPLGISVWSEVSARSRGHSSNNGWAFRRRQAYGTVVRAEDGDAWGSPASLVVVSDSQLNCKE